MGDKDEDYWNTSKKKSVNIFDDDLSVEAVDALARSKKLLATTGEDGDDDSDMINWDGTPSETITIAPKSQQTTMQQGFNQDPATSSIKYPMHSSQFTGTDNRPPSQTLSFGSAGRVSFVPATSKPSSTDPRLLRTGPTIDDAVIIPSSSKTQGSKDPAKLEEEIRFLRRSLDKAKVSGLTKFTIEETVQRMVTGEPYSLELYKSKEEKLALLDRTIAMHDGNAIIAAVLFLKRTIKPSMFNLELTRRPLAVNQYCSYLKAHYNIKELVDMFGMLGRVEEAAMLKYRQVLSITDPKMKINNLTSCLGAHFVSYPQLSHEMSMIQEQISLLERQRPIEEDDAKSELEARAGLFREYPRASSIVNMSVITTLYYCSFYHYQLQETSLASPLSIKKAHQLTEKQYLWTVLRARSRLKRWKEIEELLTTKGWFGSTKLRAAIGFDKVADILNSTNTPPEIIGKYLRLVDDTNLRLNLAKRMKCHEIVVDTLVANRDRVELEDYKRKLPLHTKEFLYARDALNSSTVKWKT
ncbi:hypothetical protein ScPMuIL_013748 [Solemya velum]